jgi:micrococcal nuclease
VLINSAANTVCNKPCSFTGFKRTSALIGRFFFSCFFVLFSLDCNAAADRNHDTCRVADLQERATVDHVIDGDTIVLSDNRHVRLIGIDTPETGRDGHKSEMGADAASDYLGRLLQTNKTIYLRYDQQRKDHYQRTLAHLFLQDGTSIQSLLLKRGLATPLTIPPNLEFLDCYQTSTRYAQQHHIGLWALYKYQATPAEALSTKHLGYRIVIGTITRIGESKSAIWINLANNMAIRITREDLKYFNSMQFDQLTGKQLAIRGWLYFMNGEYRMRIRHPVDLDLLPITDRN